MLALVDSGQHLVERIGQPSGLAPALGGRPHGIVLFLRHDAGDLGQREDRPGDRTLQPGREGQGDEDRAEEDERGGAAVDAQPHVDHLQAGLQVDRAGAPAVEQHRTDEDQAGRGRSDARPGRGSPGICRRRNAYSWRTALPSAV